jgi:hypothetical protein
VEGRLSNRVLSLKRFVIHSFGGTSGGLLLPDIFEAEQEKHANMVAVSAALH